MRSRAISQILVSARSRITGSCSVACALAMLLPDAGAHAACIPDLPAPQTSHTSRAQAPVLADPIARVLARAAACPKNVYEFRALLKQDNFELTTTMVANRGFHNPSLGSFSLFETAESAVGAPIAAGKGDLFFGHFTELDGHGRLIADQNPRTGSLMIEAFAWDSQKGWYNFYELIGAGTQGRWHYRGDSADVFADVRLLHRQPDPAAPSFGARLRCSGCHSAGGPIMKELAFPQNDWWQPERPLDLGGRAPDPKLAAMLSALSPASQLADAVKAGSSKLESSPALQALKRSLSLQERLRPLFCAVEINFESDLAPNDERRDSVQMPASFFVDPLLLATPARAIEAPRASHEDALVRLSSRFPETERADGDRAWLAPVKAASDKLAIEALISSGEIDREFAADVAAVDMQNPALSPARCELLRLLPEASSGWRESFAHRLRLSPKPAAAELLSNLEDPARDARFHGERARWMLRSCREKASRPEQALALARLLDQRRNEIRASEISKNPRGQILEPGFRVIFPESQPGPEGPV